MQAINQHDSTLEHQVAAWRTDPFDPDAIAQLRPVAYQRAIVMKYIDNLIAWGDQLFTPGHDGIDQPARPSCMCSPQTCSDRGRSSCRRASSRTSKTYADLEGKLDDFSNATVAAENAIPPVKVNVPTPGGSPETADPDDALLPDPAQLAAAGLLGHRRRPPVQDPPLHEHRGRRAAAAAVRAADQPGLLVAAAAAGLDLSSVLV